VHEIALALLFSFSRALARLAAGGAVGVLGVHSVNSTLSNRIVVLSDFLSSLETGSSALQGTLYSFQVRAGREAGSAVSGSDGGGQDRLH
jgi:hypothetical protein